MLRGIDCRSWSNVGVLQSRGVLLTVAREADDAGGGVGGSAKGYLTPSHLANLKPSIFVQFYLLMQLYTPPLMMLSVHLSESGDNARDWLVWAAAAPSLPLKSSYTLTCNGPHLLNLYTGRAV